MTDHGHVAAVPSPDGPRTSVPAGADAPAVPAIDGRDDREVVVGPYRIVGDHEALDLELAHRALTDHAYWARGRSRAVTARAFAHSRVAVALDASGATVGFGRAVTDGATFAWLADVWVEPDHRGHGVGVALVEFLVEAPDLVELRRWGLVTSDAQSLYERFGFVEHRAPPTLMERVRPT